MVASDSRTGNSMPQSADSDGGGCGGCLALFAVIMLIALLVMGTISFAALVDPFSWMPPASEIWADCQDAPETERNECALATRFPGFWVHAAVNLLYVAASMAALAALAVAVAGLRERRTERFDDPGSAELYADARQMLAITSVAVALLALLPIFVALA